MQFMLRSLLLCYNQHIYKFSPLSTERLKISITSITMPSASVSDTEGIFGGYSFLFSWQHFEHSEQQPQQPFFRERIMYLTAHISRKIISPSAIQSAKLIVTPPYQANIRLPME